MSLQIISIALYVQGNPCLLISQEPFMFKQTSYLSEQAYQHVLSYQQPRLSNVLPFIVLNDSNQTHAYYESILKNPKDNSNENFIILLSSQSANPIIITEHYLPSIQDIIKQATGLKSSSNGEQIAKQINKNNLEIEISIKDLISGVDQASISKGNKGVVYPRINKKLTDFHELKFQDIQNRFLQTIDQLSLISYSNIEIKTQQLQDIKIDTSQITEMKLQREEQKQRQNDEDIKSSQMNQSVLEKQQQPVQVQHSPQLLRGVKLSGSCLERLEMMMENQQILRADLVGQLTLTTEFPPQLQSPQNLPVTLTIEDDRWHDRQKFQIMKNPALNTDYSQQVSVQTQHIYQMELNQPQTVVLQYKMNPQLLKELPIIVMWTQEKGNFHLKYMINKKYKSLSYLAFNLGDTSDQNNQELNISSDEIKRLKSLNQFLKVEKEPKTLRLWIANMKQQQGIFEFQCQTPIPIISIEVMIKDQLLSELSSVTCCIKNQALASPNSKGAANTEMQLSVLRKIDANIQSYLFVSTFCSIFENDEATSQWMPMNYEGSLYIVLSHPPDQPQNKKYKLVLLNRKLKKDFVETIDDQTEFKQNQQYVFYRNTGSMSADQESPENNNLLPNSLRVIYFSQLEEKEQFWKIAVEQVQKELKESRVTQTQQQEEKFFTKDQVRETLVSIVQGDKFVDYFYQMLLKKYGDPAQEQQQN
eukprot:403343433